MILIQGIILSEDLVEKQFVCDLSKCKGDCCQDGDFGAPVTEEEQQIMKDIYEKATPYMDEDCIKKVEKEGMFTHYKDEYNNQKIDFIGTSLMEDERCVFMGRNEIGISYCAIEKAYLAGDTEWQKPVSCHLYPVRVEEDKHTGMTMVNYNIWNICSPACDLGNKEEVKVYEFCKDALIRKFGEEFYDELDAMAGYHNS